MAKLNSGTRIYGTATVDSTLTLQDLVTSAVTANIANTTSTTVNAFGVATAINLAATAAAATTLTVGSSSKDNTLTINGNSTTGTATLTSNVTTGTTNIFTTGQLISIGSTSGTLTVNNALTIFNSTKSIQLPVGNTAARPTAAAGQIRYNSELSTFEGYGAAWGSLGGVKSVDGLTYIIPETTPGASNGELEFYAEDATGLATVKVGGWNYTRLLVSNTTESTAYTDGSLIVSGGAGIAKKLFVQGAATFNTSISSGGNITLTAATPTINFNNTAPTIATNSAGSTASIFDTNVTTGQLFSAGTSVTIGATTGTLNLRNVTITAANATAFNINGANPSIASTDTGTASVFNANITTVNFGQAADISMSAVGKTVTVRGALTVNGNTTLGDASGDSVIYTASTGTVTTTHAFTNNDAGTNTVVYPIKFAHTLSSGTAAAGIGSGFQFTAPNASGSAIAGGSIEAVSTNVTATSEAYDVVVRAYTAGSSGTVLKANGTSLEVGASNTNTTVRSNGTGTLTVTAGTTGASSAGAIVTVTGGAGGSTTGAGGQGVFKGGDGTTSSAGGVATLKGGAAVGTNITGANTVIEAGNGTGTGGSGSIILRTAGAGSSGAVADTMTDRLTISNTGNITFAGAVTIGGDLTVNGTVTTINSSTVTIDDKNIELASVVGLSGLTVTLTNGSATVTFIGSSTTTGLLAGQTLTISTTQTGSPAFGVGATIQSVDSLTVVTMTGNTTGTSGNVTVSSSGSSDATADGGGITVKGATDKTWSYVNSTTAWTSNQNIDAASGKTYKINGTDVLSASAVLQNSATSSIGATGSAATVNIGSTSNNNILNIYANGTTGTATLGTNVTNGTVTVFAGVTNIINYSEAATTITVGNTATAAQSVSMFTASTGSSTYNFATGATLNGNTKAINIGTAGVSGSTSNISINSTVSGALGTTTIGGATLTVSTPTSINLGTGTSALTTTTVGGAITGNILKIAGVAAGTANITTDVTSGTFNIAQSVTGTVAIGASGTVQLGTSASVTTIAQVGGAVDGNTLKIAGTATGTTSGITTDVTSGTFNIAQSVTGTVKIGSSGTVQLGTSASVVTIAQVGGAIDGNTLKIAGTAAGTTSGITTDVTTGTFNIAQSVTGTVAIGASGTVQLGTSASVTTVAQVGGAVDGNTLKIAGVAAGTTSGITTDVTTGTFNIAQSVTGTVKIGLSGTVQLGTSASVVTTAQVGGAVTGNILKIAGVAAGTANITTDVTTGTFNIAQSVTGTVAIGLSGTVQLGTSASVATTAQVGGAVTGNILKIAGTAAGTINLTTDVTTGAVNVFASLTTATMTIGSANGGRVAIAFNQASTSTTTGAVTIAGGLGVAGAVNAQTKSFIISHPTKPGKLLKHGSLEGPEFGVYVRGKVTGKIIELPDYWLGLVNEDTITVDLTPIGKHQKLYVEKIEGNRVYINNEGLFSGSISCFYTVWGERKDVGSLEIELDE